MYNKLVVGVLLLVATVSYACEVNRVEGACNLHLSNLTLIGAHDAGAGAYGHLDYAPGLPWLRAPDCRIRNQNMSITDMLNSGVRYFELKVRPRHRISIVKTKINLIFKIKPEMKRLVKRRAERKDSKELKEKLQKMRTTERRTLRFEMRKKIKGLRQRMRKRFKQHMEKRVGVFKKRVKDHSRMKEKIRKLKRRLRRRFKNRLKNKIRKLKRRLRRRMKLKVRHEAAALRVLFGKEKKERKNAELIQEKKSPKGAGDKRSKREATTHPTQLFLYHNGAYSKPLTSAFRDIDTWLGSHKKDVVVVRVSLTDYNKDITRQLSREMATFSHTGLNKERDPILGTAVKDNKRIILFLEQHHHFPRHYNQAIHPIVKLDTSVEVHDSCVETTTLYAQRHKMRHNQHIIQLDWYHSLTPSRCNNALAAECNARGTARLSRVSHVIARDYHHPINVVLIDYVGTADKGLKEAVHEINKGNVQRHKKNTEKH